MEYDKEPVLVLETEKVVKMRQQLQQLNYLSSVAYSGNDDWRAKASYQKQAETLRQDLNRELKRIKNQHAADLADYHAYLKEIEEAEELYKTKTPIDSISVSDPVEDEETGKPIEVNPIMDIEL